MKKFTQTINNEAETSKWMLKNATIFTSYEQHKRHNFLSKVRRLVNRILSMEKFPTLLTFKNMEEQQYWCKQKNPLDKMLYFTI